MTSLRQKYKNITGETLPDAPAALAAYVPFRHLGNQLVVSGQLPLRDGALVYTGLVEQDVSMDDAIAAAKLCTTNILSQLCKAIDDDLTRLQGCLVVRGFVAAPSHFTKHPLIINGASEFLSEILGPELGAHARAAVGMASLPLGAPVEVEATFITL